MSEAASAKKPASPSSTTTTTTTAKQETQSRSPSAATSAGGGAIAFHDGPTGRQYNKGDGSTGKAGQELRMTDLKKEHKESIRRAVARAKEMVPAAIRKCSAAITAADPSVEYAFKLPSVGDKDRKKALNKVVENYQKVQTALAGNLGFEGENEPANEDGSVTIAYVYTGFIGLFDGNIHIAFPGWTVINAEKQATTIIHELTHQKCGTADHAYIHEKGKWAKMSTKDAVNNAGSYEYPCLY